MAPAHSTLIVIGSTMPSLAWGMKIGQNSLEENNDRMMKKKRGLIRMMKKYSPHAVDFTDDQLDPLKQTLEQLEKEKKARVSRKNRLETLELINLYRYVGKLENSVLEDQTDKALNEELELRKVIDEITILSPEMEDKVQEFAGKELKYLTGVLENIKKEKRVANVINFSQNSMSQRCGWSMDELREHAELHCPNDSGLEEQQKWWEEQNTMFLKVKEQFYGGSKNDVAKGNDLTAINSLDDAIQSDEFKKGYRTEKKDFESSKYNEEDLEHMWKNLSKRDWRLNWNTFQLCDGYCGLDEKRRERWEKLLNDLKSHANYKYVVYKTTPRNLSTSFYKDHEAAVKDVKEFVSVNVENWGDSMITRPYDVEHIKECLREFLRDNYSDWNEGAEEEDSKFLKRKMAPARSTLDSTSSIVASPALGAKMVPGTLGSIFEKGRQQSTKHGASLADHRPQKKQTTVMKWTDNDREAHKVALQYWNQQKLPSDLKPKNKQIAFFQEYLEKNGRASDAELQRNYMERIRVLINVAEDQSIVSKAKKIKAGTKEPKDKVQLIQVQEEDEELVQKVLHPLFDNTPIQHQKQTNSVNAVDEFAGLGPQITEKLCGKTMQQQERTKVGDSQLGKIFGARQEAKKQGGSMYSQKQHKQFQAVQQQHQAVPQQYAYQAVQQQHQAVPQQYEYQAVPQQYAYQAFQQQHQAVPQQDNYVPFINTEIDFEHL